MTTKRDVSIDIIKFIAVLLIINSHADIMYPPPFSILATGGSIGDSLFLFCSGYTLFWNNPKRFDNWYKRRINRIYPSVFACLTIAIIFGWQQLNSLSFSKILGGEFVCAIMVYYGLLYLVQKYFMKCFSWVVIGVAAITLVAYWFFPYKYETSSKGIYGISTYFRWIPYFGMMLMGAWIGLKAKNREFPVKVTWLDLTMLLMCIGVFYSIQFLSSKYTAIAPWQITTIPFLAGIVYYIWKCCNANFFHKLYSTKAGNAIIMLVSGVCLESYLIQYYLFTDKLNWLFPLNIILIMIVIIFVSYICRCAARLFSQTFRSEDYEWKKIITIK